MFEPINGAAAAFMSELQALTKKYKIAIDGCGCCGSPFLTPLESDEGKYECSSAGTCIGWRGDEETEDMPSAPLAGNDAPTPNQ